MSESPKISVILPVFNAEPFLKQAVDSLLKQTYRDFELLIVNDGSEDGSDKIIRSFSDRRIVYIQNPENLGLIASLNKALELAKGKYIARMDADDVALPDRFGEQVKILEEDQSIVLVASDYYQLTGSRLRQMNNPFQSEELKALLLFAPPVAHPTVMMRNVFRNEALKYDANYPHAEDFKLWMDLSHLGKFYNISKPLLKYRSHPGQVSVSHAKIQRESSERLRESFLQRLGFSFSKAEILTHHLVANNVFLNDAAQLKGIEAWFLELMRQNENVKIYSRHDLSKVIGKLWMDSCGNTSLGFKAWKMFHASEILHHWRPRAFDRLRLAAKCLVRQFRGAAMFF